MYPAIAIWSLLWGAWDDHPTSLPIVSFFYPNAELFRLSKLEKQSNRMWGNVDGGIPQFHLYFRRLLHGGPFPCRFEHLLE
jgi:hypothetical protein